MARDAVARRDFRELRLLLRPARHHERAPGMETAARWRVERARDLAAEHDLLARLVRMGRQRRREQRLRVGMQWRAAELEAVRHFDELSEVHHRSPVTQ